MGNHLINDGKNPDIEFSFLITIYLHGCLMSLLKPLIEEQLKLIQYENFPVVHYNTFHYLQFRHFSRFLKVSGNPEKLHNHGLQTKCWFKIFWYIPFPAYLLAYSPFL